MKLKEVKRTMALVIAVSTLAPSTAYAAEPFATDGVVAQESTNSEAMESEPNVEIPVETPETEPEVPEGNQDTSGENAEVPEENPEAPEENPEVPEENPEAPEEKPEIPEENPEIPEESPEQPEENPEVPDENTEEPEGNMEIPEENTEKPEENPEVPEMAPETQTQSPNASVSSSISSEKHVTKKKALRFFTVARRYAFTKVDAEIKEEMKEDSRTVGTLADKGICFLLKEEGDWYFVESGNVRGFIAKTDVVTGPQANHILKEYKENELYKDSVEQVAPVAQETIPSKENEAYFYTMGTTKQTVVEKIYAISTASALNVREGKGTDSRIIGELPNGTLCYILADGEDDWVYIESGDVRGFVSKKYIRLGENVNQEVAANGEDVYAKAIQKVSPEENEAFYYTHTSIKMDASTSKIREEIVEYASQFIGNPYVWGGTDPVKGADCSGFVQTIYRTYGIELPRVAEAQAYAGEQIPVSEAQPGDLIFYMDHSGYIHHVVMYAGDGKTVEAKGRAYGIVSDDVSSTACWAVRLLDDDTEEVVSSSDIHEVNATEDMYGDSLGEYDITYYCACETCCDVETGITATGTQVAEGRTIAVDPSVIPYGTQVIIGGHVFTAEDCGGTIKENRIDIYVNNHKKALELGRDKAEVFLVK